MSSSSYDPLARGQYPVGVRALDIPDRASGLTLSVDAWYPASERHTGEDLDPRTYDRFPVDPFPLVRSAQHAVRDAEPALMDNTPLILFSHGLGGFGKQSTFLTTHLASHGYVVLAPDHPSSALPAVLRGARRASRAMKHRRLSMMGRERLRNMEAIIGGYADADRELAHMADGERIGITGHSFGGWTAIACTSTPSRISASVALAPIGVGYNPAFEGDDAYADVDLAFADRPPTLILAAEYDSICPLRGVRRLYESLAPGHKMLVLHEAEHFHSCDNVVAAHRLFRGGNALARLMGRRGLDLRDKLELLDGKSAHLAIQGITLAHLDACLRQNPLAQRWTSADQLSDVLRSAAVRCSEPGPTS